MNPDSALTCTYGYSSVEGPKSLQEYVNLSPDRKKVGLLQWEIILFMVIYKNFRISESITEDDEGKWTAVTSFLTKANITNQPFNIVGIKLLNMYFTYHSKLVAAVFINFKLRNSNKSFTYKSTDAAH